MPQVNTWVGVEAELSRGWKSNRLQSRWWYIVIVCTFSRVERKGNSEWNWNRYWNCCCSCVFVISFLLFLFLSLPVKFLHFDSLTAGPVHTHTQRDRPNPQWVQLPAFNGHLSSCSLLLLLLLVQLIIHLLATAKDPLTLKMWLYSTGQAMETITHFRILSARHQLMWSENCELLSVTVKWLWLTWPMQGVDSCDDLPGAVRSVWVSVSAMIFTFVSCVYTNHMSFSIFCFEFEPQIKRSLS